MIGAPLVLRGAAGQTVSTRDFRGRFLLIYFGYTGCPDQCPLTMAAIAGAMRLLGSRAAMVQPLFITIDPTRDTPAVVGNYARLFSHRIIGLTGSAAVIGRAEAAFHVYVGAPDPKTGSIPHSSLIYVMGPHGRFRTALSGDLPAPKLAGALERYAFRLTL
ncbi:SCO family protein [Acidiphilium sp.]|uniref:SCO family protein n=1 Tax=Acidiphilium sp. TaxID=527 RepID=UPI003D037EA7